MAEWVVKKIDKAKISEISKTLGLPQIAVILLWNRGLRSVREIKNFLDVDISCLHDPFLMKNMNQAVLIMQRALKDKKKITIYGDYDVDGITSVALLFRYLKERGANVDYYIPNRLKDGYGITKKALDGIKNSGTNFVVTVDTGISAKEEIEYARTIGLDVLVTDHHEQKEDLEHLATAIDPKQNNCAYLFKSLAGVGVVFKFLVALEGISNTEKMLQKYSEYVCLGTIADLCPLTDENRFLVIYGLKMINEGKCSIGLKKLIQVTQNSALIDSKFVGYSLAPRINASGRLGHAYKSLELLLSDDNNVAFEIANFLSLENTRRQEIERNMFDEALQYLEENLELKSDPILVIAKENWHIGVIGIVSAKISEKFQKPSILLSVDGEYVKGSGRGMNTFNMFDALRHCSHLLEGFGGHESAVGLSLMRENILNLRACINEYANEHFQSFLTKVVEIDAVLKPSFVGIDAMRELMILQPFGIENPEPVFAMRDLTIAKKKAVGGGKHLTMTLFKDDNKFDAIMFGVDEESKSFKILDRVNVAFIMSENFLYKRGTLQLILKDIKKTDA